MARAFIMLSTRGRERFYGALAAAAERARPKVPCPTCSSSQTRPNEAAKLAGARLCDACGTRWRA